MRWGALLAVAAVLATSCTMQEEPGRPAELGTVSALEGRTVLRRGTSNTVIQTQTAVLAGDIVTAEGDGNARVTLSAGDLELSKGSLELPGGSAVTLRTGSLLVTAGASLQVTTGSATAGLDSGMIRIDGPTGRIGAYEARNVKLRAGDQNIELPAYWQVELTPDGRLENARPLRISAADALDRRFLQTALDTDASLANLATGFDAQFGTSTPPALVERLKAIGIGPAELAPFASIPRSNLVLALAFAEEAGESDKAETYLEALTLNTLGASWGLLAVEFGVPTDALVSRLRTEINGIPIPQPSPIAPPVTRPSRPSGSLPVPVTTPRAAAPSPSVSPSPGSTSILPLLPPDLRRIVDELYGIVQDLLDGPA